LEQFHSQIRSTIAHHWLVKIVAFVREQCIPVSPIHSLCKV